MPTTAHACKFTAPGCDTGLDAEFIYDAGDPFAVTVVLWLGETKRDWTFGRQLLADGRHAEVGDGDVHIAPGDGVVELEFRVPGESGTIFFLKADIDAFIVKTIKLVPFGTEVLPDFEHELAALLAGEDA